jgi:hypothetical protein
VLDAYVAKRPNLAPKLEKLSQGTADPLQRGFGRDMIFKVVKPRKRTDGRLRQWVAGS